LVFGTNQEREKLKPGFEAHPVSVQDAVQIGHTPPNGVVTPFARILNQAPGLNPLTSRQ